LLASQRRTGFADRLDHIVQRLGDQVDLLTDGRHPGGDRSGNRLVLFLLGVQLFAEFDRALHLRVDHLADGESQLNQKALLAADTPLSLWIATSSASRLRCRSMPQPTCQT
jgi:hypothetical protein